MKSSGLLFVLAALARLVSFGDTGDVVPQNYYGHIAKRLGDMLPKYHVSQRKLDDELSQRAWTNLVTFYDFDHSVFLQEDLDALAKHERTIDDEIRAGKVDFGFEVHNLFVKRLRERMLFATNLLAKAEWDFTANETYRVRRKDAPWPKTKEEAEEHWRKRIKNEILAQAITRELDAEEAKKDKKAETNAVAGCVAGAADVKTAPDDGTQTNGTEKVDTPEQNLIKKYRQYATVLMEPDEEAVLQHYLSAVTRSYDPHTDYMSPASKEDFDMEMNLTLCGVGAVLSMDDGALKIVEVMSGGPMDRDGRIKAGDKIVGVQQEKGPMEDVMWQPMKKSIKKIRGKKGTRVTLEIQPRSDPTGLVRKRYELVRDEIKLEDQAATGRIERVVLGGVTNRIGYVHLPGFYGTMDVKPSEKGFRSCAMDVNRYLADFNAEEVEGLVLDLRGNGGGSLREAVMLSALFVPNGPVVLIRSGNRVEPLRIPAGNPVAFRKPMIILTDRASASASEIVAGHLRDVGRALVLGDVRTHGKGTVQTVLGMGPAQYGSTKITTARFYRINGQSTQVKGVEADIRLPSLLDSLDIGEDKLPNALPFSSILPADYAMCWSLDRYLPQLRKLSEARLSANARYAKHLENVSGMKEISEREYVPLERESRRKMMAADRDLRELNEEDGESDDAAVEEKVEEKESRKATSRRKGGKAAKDDVVLEESLNVMSDLIRLNKGAEVPQPKGWWL